VTKCNIGVRTKSNLDVIRTVRNAFAHSMIEVTFTILPVATACGMLALSEDAKFFVEQETERKSRWQYCYACDAIFRVLLEHADRVFAERTEETAKSISSRGHAELAPVQFRTLCRCPSALSGDPELPG
jgi:hypothetical protein